MEIVAIVLAMLGIVITIAQALRAFFRGQVGVRALEDLKISALDTAGIESIKIQARGLETQLESLLEVAEALHYRVRIEGASHEDQRRSVQELLDEIRILHPPEEEISIEIGRAGGNDGPLEVVVRSSEFVVVEQN